MTDSAQPARAEHPLAQARTLFGEAGLPFPPIPSDLASHVSLISPWVYGTRTDIPNLYRFELFVTEVEDEDVSDYVVFGQAGHGFNSWAMHYYLVHGPLAILLQLAYGGAQMDNEQMVRDVAKAFAVAGDLIVVVDEIRAESRGLPGRLVVAGSDFYGSRWTWLREEGADREPDQIGWQASQTLLDALSDAMESLHRRVD